MADSDHFFGKGIFLLFIGGGVALTVLSIVLLLGLAIVGGMSSGMDTTDSVDLRDDPNPETGTAVNFADTDGEREVTQVYQVNDSTGQAVKLTGASDSYIQSKDEIELAADDTWSVSTWARVESGAEGKTMTAISADGRVIIQYNGSDSQWRAWYYDEGSRNSFTANVSAGNQPGNFSLVTATGNSTHLWVYRNGTRGETVDITTSNIDEVNVDAGNWDGTIDETRLYDDETNDSEQSTLHANPVAPRPERNRTARLMYDEGDGSTTAMYFTATRANLFNHEWVNGLAGSELVEGTDYEISQDDGTITALAGGALDGAPAVWIDYQYQSLTRTGEVAIITRPAFSLFSIGALVIPAVTVILALLGGIVGIMRMARNTDFDSFRGGGNNGR